MSSQRVVYFEHQSNGRMCALHALNSLLQGPVYTEDMLRSVGEQIDKMEDHLIKERETLSSENVAWDGFFSITVIQNALKEKGWVCMQYMSPEMVTSRLHPELEDGFLCNLREHWFGIRKVWDQWYELDSLKEFPVKIETKNLSSHLAHLSSYSTFVIRHTNFPLVRLPDPKPVERRTASLRDFESKGIYLTEAEIEGSFIQKDKPKVPVASAPYKFPEESTGRSLVDDPVPNQRQPPPSAEVDAELEEALLLSAQAFLTTLPEAPVDDGTGVSIAVLGTGGSRVVRKFNRNCVMKNLFDWLHREDRLMMFPPLAVRETVELKADFPTRVFTRIFHHGDPSSSPSASMTVLMDSSVDVSYYPIHELFPDGERFVLRTSTS